MATEELNSKGDEDTLKQGNESYRMRGHNG